MLSRFQIGAVTFSTSLPAPEGVTVTGGGRSLTVRRTLSGTIHRVVSPYPGLRTISVKSSGLQVIAAADARLLLSLHATGTPFSVTEDYSGPDEVTYPVCLFSAQPRFPGLDHETAAWCGYEMEITEA